LLLVKLLLGILSWNWVRATWKKDVVTFCFSLLGNIPNASCLWYFFGCEDESAASLGVRLREDTVPVFSVGVAVCFHLPLVIID